MYLPARDESLPKCLVGKRESRPGTFVPVAGTALLRSLALSKDGGGSYKAVWLAGAGRRRVARARASVCVCVCVFVCVCVCACVLVLVVHVRLCGGVRWFGRLTVARAPCLCVWLVAAVWVCVCVHTQTRAPHPACPRRACATASPRLERRNRTTP